MSEISYVTLGADDAAALSAMARAAGASEAYLAVFDDNHRAKRFYARHGFAEVTRCDFDLGGVTYQDCIWRALL